LYYFLSCLDYFVILFSGTLSSSPRDNVISELPPNLDRRFSSTPRSSPTNLDIGSLSPRHTTPQGSQNVLDKRDKVDKSNENVYKEILAYNTEQIVARVRDRCMTE